MAEPPIEFVGVVKTAYRRSEPGECGSICELLLEMIVVEA